MSSTPHSSTGATVCSDKGDNRTTTTTTMKIIVLALAFVGAVSAKLTIRADPNVVVADAAGWTTVNWRFSDGLVCAENGNEENIAKVTCGAKGGSGSTSTDLPEGMEFFLSMTCAGSEATVNDCTYKQMPGGSPCTEFVNVKCNGKKRANEYILNIL